MKNKFSLLPKAIIFGFALSVCFQSPSHAQNLYPFTDTISKWTGYKNSLGEIVIPALYMAGTTFANGRTAFVAEPLGGHAFGIDVNGVRSTRGDMAAQSIMLGALADPIKNSGITIKNKETESSKLTGIEFNQIDPVARLRNKEVSCSELSIIESKNKSEIPFVNHKKNGLTFLHPYTFFKREEQGTSRMFPELFRIGIQYKFQQSETVSGFGFVFPFDNNEDGSLSITSQIVSVLFLSDGNVMVSDTRGDPEKGLNCFGITCWNGKRKLDFHDISKYKGGEKIKPSITGRDKIEIIRNKVDFIVYVNDNKVYETTLPQSWNCTRYDYSPIPVFYNKGNIQFFESVEYYLFR